MKKTIYTNLPALVFLAFFLFISGFSSKAQAQKKKSKSKGTAVAATAGSSNIDAVISEVYNKYKGLQEGKNADYIPELAKVPSEQFAIVIVGTDGKVYSQ